MLVFRALLGPNHDGFTFDRLDCFLNMFYMIGQKKKARKIVEQAFNRTQIQHSINLEQLIAAPKQLKDKCHI